MVKLILGISGSLCACTSMIDPSLMFLGHALSGSVTGAQLEMLQEALSLKPRQGLPCSEKDQRRLSSLPLSPFLEISEEIAGIPLMCYSLKQASRKVVKCLILTTSRRSTRTLRRWWNEWIDLMKTVLLCARCHIILSHLPSIISSPHLLSALCFHSFSF